MTPDRIKAVFFFVAAPQVGCASGVCAQ